MKLFVATFPGKFVGGLAVVKAADADEVKRLILAAGLDKAIRSDDITVVALKGTGILFLENGDY